MLIILDSCLKFVFYKFMFLFYDFLFYFILFFMSVWKHTFLIFIGCDFLCSIIIFRKGNYLTKAATGELG